MILFSASIATSHHFMKSRYLRCCGIVYHGCLWKFHYALGNLGSSVCLRGLSGDGAALDSSISGLARPDAVPLGRSDLVRKICAAFMCKEVIASDRCHDPEKNWPSEFVVTCRALESYMLLHHRKLSKTLMETFRCIDPDRKERSFNVVPDTAVNDILEDSINSFEEQSFMSQFDYVLRKAGFHKVPDDIIKNCLKTQSKYGNIEIAVNLKDYKFLKFWVYGRKDSEHSREVRGVDHATIKNNKNDDEVLQERVIVAARSKSKNNMILKGFKDIAVGHYETLLPEAKILVPQKRRWFLNMLLSTTFVIAFVNIVMTLITDLKFHSAGLIICFMGFVVYKSLSLYDINRQKYTLEWKNLLYYRSTANNAGLVMDCMHRLHERLVKDAIIVYGMALILTKSSETVSEDEIVHYAKMWLASLNGINSNEFDFTPSAAFSLLEQLGIFVPVVKESKKNCFTYKVLSPSKTTLQLLSEIQMTAIE